jgi:hypothetical protein
MRRHVASLGAFVLFVSVVADVRLGAWAFEIHRLVTEHAIPLLPAPIRPFYQFHRAFLVEHSIDPDLWRWAGFEAESRRHFVDLDAYGPWPFTALPRDQARAVARHGRDKVERNGTLPWRMAEIYARLVKDLGEQRGTRVESVKFFSAVLSHYVADAHMPLHTTLNHDGQRTGQHGIHSRFETDLFLRHREQVRIVPVAIPPVHAPADFAFDTLIASFELVDDVLEADRRARGRSKQYDDDYFARLFAMTQPMLEQQLSRASAGVAAVLTGAWEKAGRPELPLPRARTPGRVSGSPR